MKRILILFAISLTLVSCMVPKTDYDALKTESEQLKMQNEQLNADLDQLKTEYDKLRLDYETLQREKIEAQERALRTSLHTEGEALRLLKDYYDFYNADMQYRNARVRRLSNNSFVISLEECSKKGPFSDDEFFWHSVNLTITINNDGTYNIK